MFTNLLPDDFDYRVIFSEYAQRHFIKRFSKDYKGKRWMYTQDSIFQQLKRIHALQSSQQVDQLKHNNVYWLLKYDFAVAQTQISSKASGNRCIVFLDSNRHLQTVLLVYGKTDLPKNTQETQYVLQTVQSEFPNLWKQLVS
jgi:hypothetical protein